MKKVTALLLAVLILLTASAIGEERPAVYTLAGYESNTDRDWHNNAFFARMEEKTGVRFRLEQYSNSDTWHDYLKGLSGTGSLPHVLFKADLRGYETIEMYEKGVLVDLAPYLEECCPDLCALLDLYPDVKDAITIRVEEKDADGNVIGMKDVIPSLPFINETPINCGIWVNKNWLMKAGLKIEDITSKEAFENMLRKFKDIGDIPLGFLGSFDLKFLAHMWGLYGNDFNMYLDENGKACFMPEQPNFYDFMVTMRRWYKEGLLDRDGYIKSDTLRTISSADKENPYGAVITTSVTNFLPSAWNKDYVILTPIAYEGNTFYRDYFGHATTGTFAITSACSEEQIKELLGWVNCLYTAEGAVLESVGEKNAEYLVLADETGTVNVDRMIADGNYQWTLRNESDNNALMNMRVNQLITGGTTPPGYSVDAFQKLYAKDDIRNMFEQHEKLNAAASRPFPYYTLTRSQLHFISELQNGKGTSTGIGYEVDEQMALWILGEEQLTEDSYKAFINRLYGLGLEEFKAFWQDVADSRKR